MFINGSKVHIMTLRDILFSQLLTNEPQLVFTFSLLHTIMQSGTTHIYLCIFPTVCIEGKCALGMSTYYARTSSRNTWLIYKHYEFRGWKRFSAVKSMCCSYRGPEFTSKAHFRQLTTTCKSSPGHLVHSSSLCRLLYSAHTHIHTSTQPYT